MTRDELKEQLEEEHAFEVIVNGITYNAWHTPGGLWDDGYGSWYDGPEWCVWNDTEESTHSDHCTFDGLLDAMATIADLNLWAKE